MFLFFVVLLVAVSTLAAAAVSSAVGNTVDGSTGLPSGRVAQVTAASSPASLPAVKDNTLYEDSSGSLSNGAGQFLFVGRTSGGSIRRGVIAFDIAGSVPAGSTISGVSLTLLMSRSQVGAQVIGLHRLLADWGEGTSDASGNEGRGTSATAGDATWLHRTFDTDTWASPGGDFASPASGSTSVSDTGSYTWQSTPQMVSDVQQWLDDPSGNFGWLLKGDEVTRSAKRFDSREGGNPPMLVVEFTAGQPQSLQFSESSYSVSEDGGAAVITVVRAGGTDGDVTVEYGTEAGSATSGADFLPSSGTVTFADGDSEDMTFTVPIIDDSLVEGDETLTLTLSKPTGGAATGTPDKAVLLIRASDSEVDVSEDGFVDLPDLRVLIGDFGPPPFRDSRADVNGDNVVDILDLALVAHNLGRTAPRALRSLGVERAFPNLTFSRLTGFAQPDDGSNRFYVTEQEGRIRVFPNERRATQAAVFLDIAGQVKTKNNEEGLLGLAFDPDYVNNRRFYVYYSADPSKNTPPDHSARSLVSRFTTRQGAPDVGNPDSELVIMDIPQPYGNHNGGHLAFGPDGYLYIGLGDGGNGGDPRRNGQNRATLLGSILRIDVRDVSDDKSYRIPPDNPFVGIAGARDEIWAYGLRNPWRFSFDQHTGFLWVADVGQNALEEIDVVRKGLNYGWNVMEGRSCFRPSAGCDQTGLEQPIWQYGRSDGCSVTGGYVYRSRGLPSLMGAYLYGDFCSGKIWGLRYDGVAVTEHALVAESNLNITSFGQDLGGNLYILSRNEGIYRLVLPEQ